MSELEVSETISSPRKRRPRGSGSVCRRSDGWWLAVASFHDNNGKRIRKTRYARTQAEAEGKLDLLFKLGIDRKDKLEILASDNKRLVKYGMTVVEYNTLLARQGYACACCKTSHAKTRDGKFVVDHCHKTNQVRGLLCHCCNVGIGLLGDSIAGLLDAVSYLRTIES